MAEALKPYFDLILDQRDWSWAVIGLFYLLAALVIRSWFLNPLVRRAKDLDRKVYRELTKIYLKQSVWGWLSFLSSFLIVVVLWSTATAFPITLKQALLVLAALCGFVLSIILHGIAFGTAALLVLKRVTQSQRDF